MTQEMKQSILGKHSLSELTMKEHAEAINTLLAHMYGGEEWVTVYATAVDDHAVDVLAKRERGSICHIEELTQYAKEAGLEMYASVSMTGYPYVHLFR